MVVVYKNVQNVSLIIMQQTKHIFTARLDAECVNTERGRIMLEPEELIKELQEEVIDLISEVHEAEKEILLSRERVKTAFLAAYALGDKQSIDAMQTWLQYAAQQQWEV